MEFGLLLFMAGVGLRAGGDIIELWGSADLALIVDDLVKILGFEKYAKSGHNS